MTAERRREIARLARAFSMTMDQVRAMPMDDIEAMAEVIVKEQNDRKRQAQAQQRMQSSRPRRRG